MRHDPGRSTLTGIARRRASRFHVSKSQRPHRRRAATRDRVGQLLRATLPVAPGLRRRGDLLIGSLHAPGEAHPRAVEAAREAATAWSSPR